MIVKLRSWWQQIKQHPVATILIVLFVVLSVLVIFGGYKFNWIWTGFNSPSKTLWDWLQLLGVLAIPVVVGFGAVWFTTRQGKVADAANIDNQRETALQAYIDKMSELLLEKKLRDPACEDEVRKIARVRTLTILYRLDAIRKCALLQFLYESDLIKKGECILNLRGADLSGVDTRKAVLSGANLCEVNLEMANLVGANLREANLNGADLRGADLRGAKLSFANLSADDLLVDERKANLREAVLSIANTYGADMKLGADLRGADLSEADLSETDLTIEQLKTTKSLKGATMPDGSKYV